MNNHTRNDILKSYGFMAPLILTLLLFICIPVIGTVVTSLFRDVTFLDKSFTGMTNYTRLLHDRQFWQSVRFTLLFILVSVPLEMLIGLALALVLDRKIPGRGFLRGCILIPWAIPAAVSGRTWELIYNYSYGLLNSIIGVAGLGPVNWLGTKVTAFCALVTADTWKTTPFVAIIILAGLQALPQELYAQAKVDRAGFIQRFFRITVPLLRPVLIVALLFRTIDALRIFDLIYVLTRGGPGGATTSLSLYGYSYFLSGDFGYGSAVSVALFIIAFVMSIIYVSFGRFHKVVSLS